MKNSEMILQAVLNSPRDKDAKRAYADALIEEGDELRGNFIAKQIGRNFIAHYEHNNFAEGLAIHTLPLAFRKSMWAQVVDGFIYFLYVRHNQFLKHAAFLFSKHPILGVDLVDRTPDIGWNDQYSELWCWHEISKNLLDVPRIYSLDKRIMRHMRKTILRVIDLPNSRVYRSRSLAQTAVSRACVKLGREEAGLRALNSREFGRIKHVPKKQ